MKGGKRRGEKGEGESVFKPFLITMAISLKSGKKEEIREEGKRWGKLRRLLGHV